MKIQIIIKGQGPYIASSSNDLDEIYQDDLISVNGSVDHYFLNEGNDIIGIVIGNIYSEFRSGCCCSIEKSEIKKKFLNETITELRSSLQGSFVLLKKHRDNWQFTTDMYGSKELFYNKRTLDVFATDISLLNASSSDYDVASLIHALTVYGYRPPKKHTIYSDIAKIGVGEIVSIKKDSVDLHQDRFVSQDTKEIKENDINLYAESFIEALKQQGSENGNIIFLSSGWDSTSILAGLKHIYGSKKTKCVIGRMIYSDRCGVINQFEIDRAKKMADYFGVSLSIVDLNYREDFSGHLERWLPLAKDRLTFSNTVLNHAYLAEEAARISDGGETIFAGEISDGAHNLGFSQYATYFHPNVEFREYFDKMSNYLMGPSFLKLLYNGDYKNDPVFKIISSLNDGLILEDLSSDSKIGINKQLLSSLFLRSARMPLSGLLNSGIIKSKGAAIYSQEMEDKYLKEPSENLTPENMYSYYLHLYNSFHWQGATVRGISMISEALGFDSALPFWDKGIQQFLSIMPESFGRGLDLNPTKYPLKWMLKNKIDYPMDFQTGPHSYLYDVDPTFNHGAEFLYGCALKGFFQEKLSINNLECIFDDEYFNMDYISSIANRYRNNEETNGRELSDLMSLVNLSLQTRN